MNIRNFIERLRDSQFLLPALFIAISLGLVVATTDLDSAGIAFPLLMPSTVSAARTLLATVAGAIITVAALVFSFSAVTVQLAASQYSPRIVQEFLRDRVQQSIVGLVMGTFTYALSALATLGTDGTEKTRADWTATTAVVLGVASAVSIVAFIDHVTRRIRIDDTIRRIGRRTEEAFAAHRVPPNSEDGSWNIQPTTESVVLRAATSGFIQEIDVPEMLEALPQGTIARLDVWTGAYVSAGGRLVTMWADEIAEVPPGVGVAIAIGETRTINQDPGLGIRQLVDIGLRALSPGINDPATAADVVRHLATCIRAFYLAGDPPRVFVAEGGGRLVAPHAPTVAQQAKAAFTPIRRAATEQPMVLRAIITALGSLEDELAELGRDAGAIRREAAVAADTLAAYEAAETASLDPAI